LAVCVYGKMECRMEKYSPPIIPTPPNMIGSLRGGFDTVANHIVIIVFPCLIDLLLWLGPHVQVKTLISDLAKFLLTSGPSDSVVSADVVSQSMSLIQTVGDKFNLLSLLRTIPVGIPSLMSFRLPAETPGGQPIFIDLNNILLVTSVVIGVLLVGVILGSFYYSIIMQISLRGRIELRQTLHEWLWSSIQVISLTLALIILYVVVSVPSSCAIFAVSLIGLPLGQFSFFLYFGLLLWLAFPLIFSAHGIFVNHNNAFISVQRSMVLTRMTLPTTSLFFLSVLAISEGLNILWRVPPETSWLTLLGIGGHAFISSALMAASFIFYRDADRYSQATIKIIKAQPQMPIQGD
jgi:hypothetical protein